MCLSRLCRLPASRISTLSCVFPDAHTGSWIVSAFPVSHNKASPSDYSLVPLSFYLSSLLSAIYFARTNPVWSLLTSQPKTRALHHSHLAFFTTRLSLTRINLFLVISLVSPSSAFISHQSLLYPLRSPFHLPYALLPLFLSILSVGISH